MKDVKIRINFLKDLLKKWEYEYYSLENPSVSDHQYDETLKELISLENQFPEFKTLDSSTNRVGGFVSEKFKKIKHELPMLSLGNAFDEKSLIKFNNDIYSEINLNNKISYIVEPKIDGLSISLKYSNGIFVQGITRGDGVFGEDVTENVKTIKCIPLIIPFKENIEIRGEIFLSKENFNNLNMDENLKKKFSNARNAASGALRNLDSKITSLRNLSGLFYYVPENKKINVTKQEEVLEWLIKNNFPVSKDIKKCSDINEVILYVKEMTEKRDNFKFDIDGIVIKVNDINFYDEIGYTSKFPKWAIAYKFPANIEETELLSIDTTIGRTGRVNFIANVKPIKLNGSLIKKTTLHNAEYILEKDIRIFDFVKIYKAGDIIPKIIEPVLKKRTEKCVKFIPPTKCPYCNYELVKFENEVDQYCSNNYCDEKIIRQIIHFTTRDAMNIEGLSEAIIRKLYLNKFIKKISDIYYLENHFEEIKEKNLLLKDKSLNNIFNSINFSKKNSLEKLLFGLGIRHVGFNLAKQIAKRFKNIDAIANATMEELLSIGDVGDKIFSSIFDWFKNVDNINLINELKEKNVNTLYINEHENIIVKENNKIFFNKNFVITGSFDEPRNLIKDIIESVYNSKVSSTITKNSNFLIIGKNPTQSKIEKAKNLNIEIIDIEFWK